MLFALRKKGWSMTLQRGYSKVSASRHTNEFWKISAVACSLLVNPTESLLSRSETADVPCSCLLPQLGFLFDALCYRCWVG